MQQEVDSQITFFGIVVWAIAAAFFLYEFFLRTFIGTLAHQIITDLNLNPEKFAILGSAYYITYSVMQIPVGVLTDKYGVRANLIFATALCALSAFMFSYAQGFESALISRLLMGLGSSFAFIGLLVIAINWLPRKHFGFFAGVSSFLGTMGPLLAAGPLVLFMNKTHQCWRTTLSEVGIAGLIILALMIFFIKNKPRDNEQQFIFLKYKGSILSNIIQLTKNRQAWSIAFYSGSTYVSMALLGAIWGTAFLQANHFSQSSAASIISLAWLGYAIGCPVLGAASDRTKRRRPWLILCSILGLLSTSMIVYYPIQQSYAEYATLFFLLGFAAAGQNIGIATASELSDPTTRATSLGLNNSIVNLFSALVPLVVSYFISAAMHHQTGAFKPEHFNVAFSIMPSLYMISLILSVLFINETFCKPQKGVIHLGIAT